MMSYSSNEEIMIKKKIMIFIDKNTNSCVYIFTHNSGLSFEHAKELS